MLALILALLTAADWPQFRGPNASGVASSDATPPVELKQPRWKQPLPVGHSSPAVWNDRIFLTAFDGSKKLELLCLGATDGRILWRHGITVNEVEETHVVSNPATATPLVDADRVYVYFSSYGLKAFTHSGDLVWDLPLPMPK